MLSCGKSAAAVRCHPESQHFADLEPTFVTRERHSAPYDAPLRKSSTGGSNGTSELRRRRGPTRPWRSRLALRHRVINSVGSPHAVRSRVGRCRQLPNLRALAKAGRPSTLDPEQPVLSAIEAAPSASASGANGGIPDVGLRNGRCIVIRSSAVAGRQRFAPAVWLGRARRGARRAVDDGY
jgi:hypothetical protein